MGSNEISDIGAGPTHSVTLGRFLMSKYAVTQAQFLAVTKTNPSFFTTSPPAGEVQEKRPVESVSWYDAIEFCNKLSVMEKLKPAYSLSGETDTAKWGEKGPSWNKVAIVEDSNGYRLPTEAQWEYACRAGTTTKLSYGDTEDGDYMWYETNSQLKTHEVGKKLPNNWGLYDMHGNVFEWCWDLYALYPDTTQIDEENMPTGTNRIIRGGSWWGCHGGTHDWGSAYRSVCNPTGKSSNIGFRIVRPI